MIICTNPQHQIKYVDKMLCENVTELREMERVFGKHKEIDEACKAIKKLIAAYKLWERIDIFPPSGISIQEETEQNN